MKALVIAVVLTMSASAASAQLYGSSGTGSSPNSHYVQPHVTRSGDFVAGHQRTNPNSTQRDNFGTLDNVNPYNGSIGNRRARY